MVQMVQQNSRKANCVACTGERWKLVHQLHHLHHDPSTASQRTLTPRST